MSTETDPARDALHERLFDELVEADKPTLVSELVLAAFEGADALKGVLGGTTAPPTEPRRRARARANEIPGVYLKSISVRGFRGVGPMSTLSLRPGPGLTLVTGRNGSGKSSFTEAAELTLTGTNERVRRGRIWKDGWRNLHSDETPRVEVELTAEGVSRPLRVVRVWPADSTDLFAATTTVREHGEAPRPLADLAWQDALTEYRPFLAYSELSGLITDGNARIFDAMDGILGLDDLTRTYTLLQQAHSELDKARRAVRDGRSALFTELVAATDPRASTIRTALESAAWRRWDLDTAHAAATGGTAACGAHEAAPGSHVAPGTAGTANEAMALRWIVALTVPGASEVAGREAELRDAVAGLVATAGTPAAEARRIAGLLRAGLDHHQAHGDSSCPLCGVGTLDEIWRASAAAEAERLSALAKEADDADLRLHRAFTTTLALITEPPLVLDTDQTTGPAQDAAGRARDAWAAWARLRTVTDAERLAAELAGRHQTLLTALDALRSTAHARLETIETAWNPLARRVLDWVDAARDVRDRQPLLDALKDAVDFTKKIIDRLRDERLAPFAAQQAAIWSDLRQESNVDLGPVQLRGTATRRRLVLDVTVDGAGAAALGVMSQGELHALGLALFLPRATVPESPFRFIVIDDPVQAMDPAKVDGLARVLLRTAETRQVVVFTHDDRLADAVRRFSPHGFPAQHLDVVRREQSGIEIRQALDPASRCLDEAWAVARTDGLPEDVKMALVPALCKSAVDAVCIDVFRRRRLAAGERHHDVEDRIAEAPRTATKAALAIFNDTTRERDLLSHISNKWGWSAGNVFKTVKGAGHGPWGGDYTALVRETREFVEKLGELR